MKLPVLLCLCLGVAAAEESRTLRISTWPSNAEIYVGSRPESFAEKSPMTTPREIPLYEGDTSLRVTFFKPGYTDTTIDVRVAIPGKSFLWVELSEESDLDRIDWQNGILEERERKRWGKRFFFSGILPFALSGAFAGIAEWNFQSAEDDKSFLEKSLIRSDGNFQSRKEDFDDKRERGEHFRTAAFVSLGVGALLWAAAAIFTF